MALGLFDRLFKFQDQRLSALGNPLTELNEVVNWEAFRPLVKKVHEKDRKTNAGAKPRDLMMLKGLALRNPHGLSDDQLAYQIEDRHSFQWFLGLSKQ